MSNNKVDKVEWDMVIEPHNQFLNLNLKEVWRYRDLLFLFVKRDFIAQYKQTIMGPLWHFIQPILTTIMFLIVFGKIAGIKTDPVPPILFYMGGITIWNYFSSCFISTSNTFVANASIFGKVYFPRLIIPLSAVLSNIIKFAIQFLLLSTAMIYYHFHGFPITIHWQLLLIPVFILMMALLSFGLGIIISSLTTKYRDFTVLIGFGVQLLLYVTPIAYPMSFLQNSRYKVFIEYNPLTSITEAFRFSLFHSGNLNWGGLLYSASFILITLLIGLITFSRVERTFMDTV